MKRRILSSAFTNRFEWLPGGFGHAGQFAAESQFTKLKSRDTEFAEETSCAACDLAAIAETNAGGVFGHASESVHCFSSFFIRFFEIDDSFFEFSSFLDDIGVQRDCFFSALFGHG